jgi:phosphoribosylglycinamide formyltransferase-1
MGVEKLKLAVFISGGGSNLQSIIDACQQPDFPAEIALVLSNNTEAYGLERARKSGIKTAIVPHQDFRTRKEFESEISRYLAKQPIDLICLAGFMRILTPEFTKAWEGKMINTHPALLPKHGGKGMYGEHVHKAVIAAKDSESGVTIHYVIPDVDQGEIILQRRIPVRENDTHETLAARVLAQEHIAYPEAIRIIADKRLPRP